MERSCKAYQVKHPSTENMPESKAINHGVWQGNANQAKFVDALTNFMTESWTVVCQVREKHGLNAECR